MDDDDEERSRGIPSRTGIGKRGSIIEKFPALGAPLVLFGGLITIPYWGWRIMPIALLDTMIADLPHIQYHPKQPTEEECQNRVDISRDMAKTIQEKGLGAIKGLNLNFSDTDKVIDGDALLKELNANK